MKTNYSNAFLGMAALLSLSVVSCAQNPKVKTKTITIVNGDTTITEGDIDDKEIEKMMKDISIVVSDDGNSTHEKKIVKKIIIDGDEIKESDSKAMAYAYSIGDGEAEDIEVTTDEKGGETRVIIKTKGDKREKDEKGDKHIVTKTVHVNDGKEEKSHMSLNINVNSKGVKVDVTTGSKSPLNVSVLDENGKQVFYETQKDGGKFSKDIPLAKGTYFLNLIQDKKSTTEKIVIE